MAPMKDKSTGGLKQGTLFSFFTKKPAAPSAPPKASGLAKSAPAKPVSSKTASVATGEASLVDQVTLGCRIEVYWKDDDEYYTAKVAQKKGASYFLEYEEDGTSEWLDLAQETFRFPPTKEHPRKKRRIQEDEDEEDGYSDEAEFQDDQDDDEESAYLDGGNEPEEEEDDDQWMVTDDEDDMEVAKSSKKKKASTAKPKQAALKVTRHASQKTPAAKKSVSALSQFGHTPQQVTPRSCVSTNANSATGQKADKTSSVGTQDSFATSLSAVSSPLASKTTTNSNPKPPPFVEKALNSAGSHVHNHLPFLWSNKIRDINGKRPMDEGYDGRTVQVVANDWKRINGKPMTDAVQQWWDLKAQYFDTVLLFKTGKFYEMFHMDADIAVKTIGLLYMKGHVAHAGFPEISYGSFADKLVRAGYKVARVEQTETPDQLKIRKKNHPRSQGPAPKVVNREVCSVMSLGTRTFCYLDERDNAVELQQGSSGPGPLLAIREVPVNSEDSSSGDNCEIEEEQVQPVCEYGITLVDAVNGSITIGQFADDILRSRMTTLLASFAPSEILIQGGQAGASPTLQSLIKSFQTSSPRPFRVETIQSQESYPKSTALDNAIRQELNRGSGRHVGRVQPWNVEETLDEIHRRKYYPRASKLQTEKKSVSRWPQVLRAAVEGKAELALSSFGAALYYLQRNLIDAELLSMGIVQAYIPPKSTTTQSTESAIQQLEEDQTRSDTGLEFSAPPVSPSEASQVRPPAVTQCTPQAQEQQTQQVSLENQINHMSLDGTTLHNLEILTNSVDFKTNGSLWSKINYTKTPHGARMLRAWLLRPLFRKVDIDRRADAVEELVSGAAAVALSEAFSVLSKCGDIERLLARIHSMSGRTVAATDDGFDDDAPSGVHPSERAVLYETATYTKRKVGDFSKLLNGLRYASQIPEIFQGIEIESGLLRKIVCQMDQGGCFPDMVEDLEFFFANFDCDQAMKGLFEPSRGVDAAYDEACETIERIQADLEDYKNEMCQDALTPRSLAKSSWKYANTSPESKDKYLIELPATVNVPDDFIIKGKRGSGSKLVNKYRTPVVQDLVDELERALDVQKERKARGMQLIFARFDTKRALWAAAAQTTALLDALGSLAQVASKAGYTRPAILDCPPDGAPTITVSQGRHPCVENTLGSTDFVPNDLTLGTSSSGGAEPRVLLLSGPNMGGKSTLLRQTCLISILAQMGSFVPAESCELTPIDRIYTRLGASDRLLLGQSTFFVELAETAAALRGANRRSLVIMDELGRGTSTFDGTAIASATVKHLVERSKCLSLFATHYHSLLDEWKDYPSVKLGHMECVVGESAASTDNANDEANDDTAITFLYTLGPGACPKSFGINVARLAGLPEDALLNAKRISAEFEQEMSGRSTGRVVTADSAPLLKAQIEDAMQREDWGTVSALWNKMRAT